MPIYLPKKIVPITPKRNSPLFFLAGPVRGSGDWQVDMAEHLLYRRSEAHIACPTRWDSTHRIAHRFHQPFSQAPNRQLVWERHYLKQAGITPKVYGCVVFWLGLESVSRPHPGPEPYAMDTRREIGKFTAYLELLPDVRVVVGGNRNFHGLEVILYELSKAIKRPFHFYENMADLAKQAIRVAQQ